jgi:hypothetical protein
MNTLSVLYAFNQAIGLFYGKNGKSYMTCALFILFILISKLLDQSESGVKFSIDTMQILPNVYSSNLNKLNKTADMRAKIHINNNSYSLHEGIVSVTNTDDCGQWPVHGVDNKQIISNTYFSIDSFNLKSVVELVPNEATNTNVMQAELTILLPNSTVEYLLVTTVSLTVKHRT